MPKSQLCGLVSSLCSPLLPPPLLRSLPPQVVAFHQPPLPTDLLGAAIVLTTVIAITLEKQVHLFN